MLVGTYNALQVVKPSIQDQDLRFGFEHSNTKMLILPKVLNWSQMVDSKFPSDMVNNCEYIEISSLGTRLTMLLLELGDKTMTDENTMDFGNYLLFKIKTKKRVFKILYI